jgi:hypothetical protein
MSLLKHYMMKKSHDNAQRIIHMIEEHKVDLTMVGHSLLMQNWAKMGNREAAMQSYANFLRIFQTTGSVPSFTTLSSVMKSLNFVGALDELCELWATLQADSRVPPQCALYSTMMELMALSMDRKASGEIVLQAVSCRANSCGRLFLLNLWSIS